MHQIVADLHLHLNAASVAWTLIAGAGGAFSASVLPRYIGKLPVADAIANADDRRVARDLVHDYILAECIRAAQHVPALVVGLVSFVVTPAPHAAASATTERFAAFVILVLLWNSMLATANSVRAYLAWRRRYGVVAAGQRRGVRRRKA
jgi:CBS domain containing-hemolysin-like protein